MSQPRNRLISTLLILTLLGTAVVASGCGSPAKAAADTATQRSITVIGQGSVSGKPDLALASLGVETNAKTVADAVKQNNDQMAAVLAKLQELGIAEKDIQTSNFSINSVNYGQPSTTDSVEYRVSNMVQVKIRDPQKVGAIIDAMVQAGVNQVYGVGFTIEDQKALQDQARVKAMEDARQRGESLAKLANVQLGQPQFVSENGSAGVVFSGAAYGKGGGDSTQVSPGEVEVTYQVQVTFAIE